MRPLPPDPHNMGTGRPDMENDLKRGVGPVPDGLHYQDILSYVSECIQSGPQRIQRRRGGVRRLEDT